MPRADQADTVILHSCRGQGQASSSWWTRMTSLHPHSIISWAVLITCPWKRNGGGELLNIRRHQILLGTVTFSPATEGQRRQSISLPVASIHTSIAVQLSQLWASLCNYCYSLTAPVFHGARDQIQDFRYDRQPFYTTEPQGPAFKPSLT